MPPKYGTPDDKPTAENVVQTALEAATVAPIVVTDLATYAVVPTDRKVVKLPRYMEKPDRKMAKVSFLDVEDFIAYVNQQKLKSTRMWAQRGTKVIIEAIIDYHDHYREEKAVIGGEVGGLPQWGMHRAILTMEMSEEFKPWADRAGQYMNQLDFAEFIDDNAAAMNKPDPAAMSELALNLQGTENAVFKSNLDPHNGNVVFTYEQTNTPKGSMEIPRVMGLFLPVIEGTAPQHVPIKLQWRLGEGHPQFAWRIPAIGQLMRDAMRQQMDVIAADTQIPVWVGNVTGMQQPETLTER